MESPVRVVLVDDMDNFRTTLRAFLRLSDIEVVGEAQSAKDARTVVGQRRPDVIVLDLDLGEGMGGLELLPYLRKASPQSAVVVLSAYSDPEVSQRALGAGADAFVAKLSMRQIVSTIRSVVADPHARVRRSR